MPKVNVEKSSQMPPDEAFTKLKGFLENDEGLRKLDANYVCAFNDSALSGTAKGKQFKANMDVTPEGSGSKVNIVVDLPLLLSPFKGKVKETLERKLTKVLA